MQAAAVCLPLANGRHCLLLPAGWHTKNLKITKMKFEEILQKAKELFPYDSDNENRVNKLSSKRRRFIQGAEWVMDEYKRRFGCEEWINCSDLLPSDQEKYLCFIPEHGVVIGVPDIDYNHDNIFFTGWTEDQTGKEIKPSHWMALPDSPKEK